MSQKEFEQAIMAIEQENERHLKKMKSIEAQYIIGCLFILIMVIIACMPHTN